MNSLNNKNILLGISGGIAAYKSAELSRLLIKAGANVKVCMTPAAQAFITPLTLQALSGDTVHTELLDPAAEAGMGHIELARWADILLIAPATADLMARLRAGMAGDLLSTVALATNAPLHLAPAMNQQMWAHPATQNNVQVLQERAVIHGPDSGEQACGDAGAGRMMEPADIVAALANSIETEHSSLAQHHFLITAGPTREPLDPVRYLSNRSSGKMGYALARAAFERGAEVTVVSGPTQLDLPAGINKIDVMTAEEMLQAVTGNVSKTTVFIAAAAVADYRMQQIATSKIKKNDEVLTLQLERNPDILAQTSHNNPKLFTVGFAAETDDVLHYASGKLKRKKLDMIVANQVGDNKVFGQDDNQVEILTSDKQHFPIPKMNKDKLSHIILDHIDQYFTTKRK